MSSDRPASASSSLRPSLRRALVVFAISFVGLSAAGIAGFWATQRSRVILTDTQAIRANAETARPRTVLWTPPLKLPPWINRSSSDILVSSVATSPHSLLFASLTEAGDFDLFQARANATGFDAAAPLAQANSPADDVDAWLSADGDRLYFASNREGGLGSFDIYLTRRTRDGAWTEPTPLSINTRHSESSPALSTDGSTLYFASNRPRAGDPPDRTSDFDIYAVALDAQGLPVSSAAALDTIDTEADEAHPTPSPAGDFLYFVTNAAGGAGKFDIWRSRLVQGDPTPPEPLPAPVNSPHNELSPALDAAGFTLYFSSDRPAQGSDASSLAAHRSVSKEVIAERLPLSARVEWRELVLWLALLTLVCLLLGLAGALTTGAARARLRQLNLLTKCLLASLLAHALLLLALTAWRVSVQPPPPPPSRPVRVQLSAPAGSETVVQQVRGSFTRVESLQTAEAPVPPTSAPPEAAAAPLSLAAEGPTTTDREALQTSGAPPAPPEAPAALPQEDEAQIALASTAPPVRTVAVDSEPAPARQRAQEESGPAATPVVPVAATTPAPSAPAATPSTLTTFEAPSDAVALNPTLLSKESFADQAPDATSPPATTPSLSPALADAPPARPAVATPSTTAVASPAEPEPQSAIAMRTTQPPAAALASPQPPSGAASLRAAPLRKAVLRPAASRVPAPVEASAAVPLEAPAIAAMEPSTATTFSTPAAPPPRATSLAVRPEPNAVLTLGDAPLQRAPQRVDAPSPPSTNEPALATVAVPAPRSLSSPAAASAPVADAASPSTAPRPMELASAAAPQEPPRTVNQAQLPAEPSPAEPPSAREPALDIAAVPAPLRREPFHAPRTMALPGETRMPTTAARARRVELQLPSFAAVRPASASLTQTDSHAAPTSPVPPAIARFSEAPVAAAVASPSPESEPQASLALHAQPARRTPPRAPVQEEANAVPPLPLLAASPARTLAVPPADAAAASAVESAPTHPPSPALPSAAEPPLLAIAPAAPRGEPLQLDPFAQRKPETRKALVQAQGGSEETEEAVALALAWLAAQQQEDGRWDDELAFEDCTNCRRRTPLDSDVALTGLALLCFEGAGHTHVDDGPYRDVVAKGLAFLLSKQNEQGDLRAGETMYSHGVAAIALAEALGMTGDPTLRAPVERAVRFIAAAHNPRAGGWRYEPGMAGDTSVLGWMVMALVSAQRAGVAPPPGAFDAARDWLDRVSTDRAPGLFAYQPGGPVTHSMTAEAMFTLQLLGEPKESPRLSQAESFLLTALPDWEKRPSTYYWYYATLALYQQQGEAWKRWNQALTSSLLHAQRRDGAAAGSWDPKDRWSAIGGRVYQTALCTLSLEIYYRYLPRYLTASADSSADKPSHNSKGRG